MTDKGESGEDTEGSSGAHPPVKRSISSEIYRAKSGPLLHVIPTFTSQLHTIK